MENENNDLRLLSSGRKPPLLQAQALTFSKLPVRFLSRTIRTLGPWAKCRPNFFK